MEGRFGEKKSQNLGRKIENFEVCRKLSFNENCDIAEKVSIKKQALSNMVKNSEKIKANMETRKRQSSCLKRVRLVNY